MPTGWYEFDPARLPRGVVVADATAAAAPFWQGPILTVLEDLAAGTPPDRWPEVAFLGGDATHPLAAVLRGLGSDAAGGPGPALAVADHLGRYPVLGPLLWALSRGPARPVLLVTTRPVPDLEDWATPEVARRLLVYRLTGEGRVTPDGFRELDTNADLSVLADHLADPVRRVRVGGGAALAVDWSNPAYGWTAGGLEADGGDDFALAVRLAHPDGHAPDATVTRAGGEVRVPLVSAVTPPAPAALALRPAEGTVLETWVGGRPYYCLGCRRNHPPGQVRCPAGAGDVPLFPTLAALPPGTVCRAAGRAGAWTCRPLPQPLAPLPDGRVVAWFGDAAEVYAPAAGGWAVAPDDPGPLIDADGEFLLRT